MSRSTQPLTFHVVLGIVCLGVIMVILPSSTTIWQRVVAGILSVSFGYQIATALSTAGQSNATRMRAWLEALAFPILIAAVQILPQSNGWVLLAVGMGWRFLVAAFIR